MTRDRFLANALLPAAWVVQAQRVRHWFARRVARVFENVDVLLAPATPCVAPVIGTEWLQIGGKRLPARASMGLLTQPISCIGLPVVSVPLWGMSRGAAAPAHRRAADRRALARGPRPARRRRSSRPRACAARRWRRLRGPVTHGLQPPRGAGRAECRLCALRGRAGEQPRRGAGRTVLGQRADRALRRQREPLRHRRDPRLPQRTVRRRAWRARCNAP